MLTPDKVKFNKKPTEISEQISILKSRNMIITDELFAEECLKNIGYYRLSGYWFKFQNKWIRNSKQYNIDDEIFTKNIEFKNIIDIYRFDTKIRSLILDALEKIEISLSSNICNLMCNKYSKIWYRQRKYFDLTDDKFSNISKIIDDLIEKNKNTLSLDNFYSKYSDKYPPFWIVSPFITFGVLSKIYSSLKTEYKKEIATMFDMSDVFMESSLRSLSNVRNICAHYGRLWDIDMKTKSLTFKFATKLSRFNYKSNKQFFSTFYNISLFLLLIARDSKSCSLIKYTSDRYIDKTKGLISYGKMGFPDDWENLPLFKIMLSNKLTPINNHK